MVSFPRYFTVCITYQPPLVVINIYGVNVHTLAKVSCKAKISTFLAPLDVKDSNLCTKYRTEKLQNNHLSKIPNRPCTAQGPFIKNPKRAKCYQVTVQPGWQTQY